MLKIAFFIGSLVSGGKERRFVELLTYLTKECRYKILVITTSPEMHFPQFEKLEIDVHQIRKKERAFGINIPLELLRILREFNPAIVHTWGRIQTLYILPAKISLGFQLVNGQITNASKAINMLESMIDTLNFRLSNQIVANSFAGLDVYAPPRKKSVVIKNGMNLSRFEHLPNPESVRIRYGIITRFAIVMVATFSENKDYLRYLEVANEMLKTRDDVSFLAVGTYHKNRKQLFDEFQKKANGNPKIKVTGVIHEVESLVNACDIGVLFTNNEIHGEGISNAVLEYMALGKPVLANDSGGTREIIHHKKNGFLATNETPGELASILNDWLNDQNIMNKLGRNGRKLIHSEFSIETMGKSFAELYQKLALKTPS
jgi:glycosyltransferase involved in cell wall biosynthesis